MTGELKRRAQALEIEDLDWYIEAYMRCCARIEDEEKRSGGKNLTRLQRNLQTLFDKIIPLLEEDKANRERARATAAAINHAVSDHHLPREMLRPYAADKPTESA